MIIDIIMILNNIIIFVKKVGNHCSKYICEKRNYYEELIKIYKQITK